MSSPRLPKGPPPDERPCDAEGRFIRTEEEPYRPRGRPPRADTKSTESVRVRLTEDEKEALELYCRTTGTNASEIVRQALRILGVLPLTNPPY